MSAQETLAYLTTQVGSMLEPGVCEALCAVVERGEVPTIPRVDPGRNTASRTSRPHAAPRIGDNCMPNCTLRTATA